MLRGAILTIIGLIVSLYASAQLTGVGTLNNPYSGTLTSNLTITGTKYFGGNIIVDNETLTITAGSKFVSTSSSACIKIIGTGVLYAVGTAASPITITGDTDRDKINGEATDTWGDIYITSSAASTISYCTVERGKRTDAKLGSMGGGLYLSNSSTTVSNTTVRYCTAIKGGGIYVAAGHSPVITACLFQGNSASETGGAVYVSSSATPVISDDIFNANSTTSATYQGGALASISASPSVVNCVFAYNTATVATGNAIYLENSPGSKIVNTIIWGGTNQIAYSGTTSSVFAYCAIQGETYSNCLTLNSSNTATDGPNFTSPTTGDFSISFDSPLRDVGASAYSGVTIPPSDYIGTLRIGKPDIGAYEMLYSRWSGIANTDWARPVNWANSYSPGTRNIIIPAGLTNYPILNPGPSFTLAAGYKMIVEPGAKVTFNALTNNGTINLDCNGDLFASLIAGSYSGASGSLNIKQHLTGSLTTNDWHYIAPPAAVNKSVITDITPYNLLGYDETKVTTSVSDGWQWHDGYGGTTGFSTIEANKGYLTLFDADTTIAYKNLKTMTTSIGQVNLSFSGTGKDTSLFGYSCLGNSLTCAINWDLVTFSDATNVRDAIYIQDGEVVASYVNGVGTNGGSAHIPPLQGFMVKTRAAGTYLTIPTTAKEHNFTARLKSASLSYTPLVRLQISSPAGSDETVLRIESSATDGFDMAFDADKIIPFRSGSPQIYTALAGNQYSINSIPWPAANSVIPLIVKIPVAGTYMINVPEMHGLENEKIYLTDNKTGYVADLSAIKTYSFSADEGTLSSRFSLTVSNENPTLKKAAVENTFTTFQANDHIAIVPQGEEWSGMNKSTVRIYDSSGKLLLSRNEEFLVNGERKDYYPAKPFGLLIVEVTSGNKKYYQKIIFNQ
ncbi:MAG TPA: right-handed parallel beta-helix repeat-containing protein [Bacteroidales bacterium]|nr:right-handed parallel beta-helix repeat-containing protein [Bacteroidales bacterium]